MGVKSIAIVAVVNDWVLIIGYGLWLTIPIEDGIDVVGIKIK